MLSFNLPRDCRVGAIGSPSLDDAGKSSPILDKPAGRDKIRLDAAPVRVEN
jgi:hypothetical protein